MSDVTVNVTNAGAAGVTVTNGSTVNATVGNGGSVSVATGTISPGNATVVSGTVNVGKVTTLSSGSSATVTNSGTTYNAVIDFGIPAGPASTVSVGSTTTLSAGSNATVTATTSGGNVSLAFGIPAGKAGSDGTTPSISIGTVTTGAAGSSASVTANTVTGGVSLDFIIPRGDTGATGSGGSGSYTLPTASDTVLGGIKVGSGLSISSGVLSATGSSYSLPTASDTVLGGIKVGNGLTIASGVLSATASTDARWNAFLAPPPTGITGKAAATTVDLTWTPTANATWQPTRTGHVVQQSGNGTDGWTTLTTDYSYTNPHLVIADGASNTTAQAASLTTGNGYWYRVACVNPIGTGPWSSVAGPYYTSASGDPSFSSVAALLNFNGSWTDLSSNARTVYTLSTPNGTTPTISTSVKKWGSGSGNFGVGDSEYYGGGLAYIDGGSNSAFDLYQDGNGNWTVEFWFLQAANTEQVNALSIQAGSFDWYPTFALDLTFRPGDGGGGILARSGNGNSGWTPLYESDLADGWPAYSMNEWHHFALVSQNGMCSAYLDGQRRGTPVASRDSWWQSKRPTQNAARYLRIGRQNSNGSTVGCKIYLDDVRVTMGVRYTGATYTVPTDAFPTS